MQTERQKIVIVSEGETAELANEYFPDDSLHEDLARKKAEVVARYGDWTAHNIHLGGGVYTISENVRGDELLAHRVLQIAADVVGRNLESVRVLDLACLEGLYAVEFALHGAQTLGIEVRETNIEKARLAKDTLELPNLEFSLDDVRNLSAEKYGTFDVVLCLGILYHLDAPDLFEFVGRMAEVCRRCLIIDTHVSLTNEEQFFYAGKEYWGRFFTEHREAATTEEKEQNLWASIDNRRSVWLTRPSLFNLLAHAGFTSVYECYNPPYQSGLPDRFTFVAIKGEAQSVISSPLVAASPVAVWPPREPKPATPSGFRLGRGANISRLRRVGGKLPAPVKSVIKRFIS